LNLSQEEISEKFNGLEMVLNGDLHEVLAKLLKYIAKV
jgi:hypothetical protein